MSKNQAKQMARKVADRLLGIAPKPKWRPRLAAYPLQIRDKKGD